MADRVRVFEVGPRDGLQNEPYRLTLSAKIHFINALVNSGIQDIELGAFVRPDRVPQMADTEQLAAFVRQKKINLKKAHAWFLVPNTQGLKRAIGVGVTHFAVFTASTETFNQKNIGMSISESLKEIQKIVDDIKKMEVHCQVRGYLSTAFGCPFEGRVKPQKALKLIEKLANLGICQISIGDTIGVATPSDVTELIKPALKILGVKKTAVHFHDTRGVALANALRSLDLGVRVMDSSAGGLGGCPFAPGASGNLPTEDLVYMLNRMGIDSGVHLESLCRASLELSRKMNRPLTSRYLQAYRSQS